MRLPLSTTAPPSPRTTTTATRTSVTTDATVIEIEMAAEIAIVIASDGSEAENVHAEMLTEIKT